MWDRMKDISIKTTSEVFWLGSRHKVAMAAVTVHLDCSLNQNQRQTPLYSKTILLDTWVVHTIKFQQRLIFLDCFFRSFKSLWIYSFHLSHDHESTERSSLLCCSQENWQIEEHSYFHFCIFSTYHFQLLIFFHFLKNHSWKCMSYHWLVHSCPQPSQQPECKEDWLLLVSSPRSAEHIKVLQASA